MLINSVTGAVSCLRLLAEEERLKTFGLFFFVRLAKTCPKNAKPYQSRRANGFVRTVN